MIGPVGRREWRRGVMTISSRQPAATDIKFPITIAQWPRYGRDATSGTARLGVNLPVIEKVEVIRVALNEYKGHRTIDVRTWYRAKSGDLRPGPPGITLGIASLPALADAINQAFKKAIELGIVDKSMLEKEADRLVGA